MDIKERIIKRIKETEDYELILTEYMFSNCANGTTELKEFLKNIDNKHWEEYEEDFVHNELNIELFKRSERIIQSLNKQIKLLSNQELEEGIKGYENDETFDYLELTEDMKLYLLLDDDNYSKLYELIKGELSNRINK